MMRGFCPGGRYSVAIGSRKFSRICLSRRAKVNLVRVLPIIPRYFWVFACWHIQHINQRRTPHARTRGPGRHRGMADLPRTRAENGAECGAENRRHQTRNFPVVSQSRPAGGGGFQKKDIKSAVRSRVRPDFRGVRVRPVRTFAESGFVRFALFSCLVRELQVRSP